MTKRFIQDLCNLIKKEKSKVYCEIMPDHVSISFRENIFDNSDKLSQIEFDEHDCEVLYEYTKVLVRNKAISLREETNAFMKYTLINYYNIEENFESILKSISSENANIEFYIKKEIRKEKSEDPNLTVFKCNCYGNHDEFENKEHEKKQEYVTVKEYDKI